MNLCNGHWASVKPNTSWVIKKKSKSLLSAPLGAIPDCERGMGRAQGKGLVWARGGLTSGRCAQEGEA